VGATTTTIK